MLRRGITLLEMIIVLIIIGTTSAYAYPKLKTAQNKRSTQAALREVTTQLARAKATAVQRACRATLKFKQSENKVWITACKLTGSALDTIGTVSYLNARYGVTITVDQDSLPFGPNSLGLNTATTNMTFTKSGQTSTLTISSIGRPTW
ncbi:MAG TPA: prepilin-type N-terminal cleavage/methylation domain-containing protein [Gemmatimonadaceae bacterium]|nr:prepilin-type N-terminal cleavage/methylation domain-containing protein [Gemmatimonadaceae bacterium]